MRLGRGLRTRDTLHQRVDARAKKPLLAELEILRARTDANGFKTRRYGSADVGNAAPSAGSRRGQFGLCVGIDVVSVAEVAAALDRFGDRYMRRVFTSHEADYCRAAASPATAARLAVRFAAKEAAVKALQPDRRWTDWRAIEVRRHKSGRCAIVLHREAASLACRRGIKDFALSMSHDGDHAVAIVLARRASRIRQRER